MIQEARNVSDKHISDLLSSGKLPTDNKRFPEWPYKDTVVGGSSRMMSFPADFELEDTWVYEI